MNFSYLEYKYLHPPRAENKIPPKDLKIYDDGKYIAEPKYNGSATVIFMNETDLKGMNRHGEPITLIDYSQIDFRAAYRGTGYIVLVGELLNKNQAGEHGPFNMKFIIWDILVFNGTYLIGYTVRQRLELLEQLYPCVQSEITESGQLRSFKYICITGHKGIYKTPAYLNGFTDLYQDIIKTPVYEGLVLKRLDAPLVYGITECNNHTWQVKCRKPTKNYRQ